MHAEVANEITSKPKRVVTAKPVEKKPPRKRRQVATRLRRTDRLAGRQDPEPLRNEAGLIAIPLVDLKRIEPTLLKLRALVLENRGFQGVVVIPMGATVPRDQSKTITSYAHVGITVEASPTKDINYGAKRIIDAFAANVATATEHIEKMLISQF